MQFSLLNNQIILYEPLERNSSLFYKNNYSIRINTYTKIGAQKEYNKTIELLVSIFNFYFFEVNSTAIKMNILSSGSSKKEQVHRSHLDILKTSNQSFTLFSTRFQNFLFLLQMVYTNFYQSNLKYFVKKNRFLKNFSVLFFSKIRHFTPYSSNKINKSAISRLQYLVNFSGLASKDILTAMQ